MPGSSLHMSGIRSLLVLMFGTVCLSFAAVFVKLLGMGIMDPTPIGFWRTFLGAIILFAWSMLARKSLRMSRTILLWSFLGGFIFFLDLFFWHRSIIYSGAGMATILASTQVFITAVLGYFAFREKLTSSYFIIALSAIVGVALLIGFGGGVEFSRRYVSGVVFGLLTGVVYGGYIIIMKKIGHLKDRPDFRTIMAWTSLFTAFFLFLASLIEGSELALPNLYSLSVLVALAMVVQVLGWRAITSSLPKLTSSKSALTLVLQPVLATVWGVIFFDEYLTVIQLTGAVITIGAIYLGSVRRTG